MIEAVDLKLVVYQGKIFSLFLMPFQFKIERIVAYVHGY